MKILFALLALVIVTQGGEISERFLKAREQKLKDFQEEQDPAKRRVLMTNFFQLGQRFELPNSAGVETGYGVISTNHGVTEIGIERTTCFGTCPSYTFTVTSDGKVRYQGGDYARIAGTKTGAISLLLFHRVAEVIHDSQYIELRDSYTASVTDYPTTYTTVVVNGKRKTVSNYASAGPTRLWAIEQLIDSMIADVNWDKKRAKTR